MSSGFRIEPERPEDRHTPFHKRIVKVEPIPNTRAGNTCTLECGHSVQTFGDLSHAAGVALCQECRAAAAEADMQAKFLAELQDLSARHPRIDVAITPLDAWVLLSFLQLALRHPQAAACQSAETAGYIARRLQMLLAPPGSVMEEIAERGWRGE